MSSTNKDNSTNKDKDLDKDHTWFLVNCIMSTDSGRLEKIKWDTVAGNLNMVSKDAARFRYARILAAYGLTTAYTSKDDKEEKLSSAKIPATTSPKITARKRKSSKRKRIEPKEEEKPEVAHPREEEQGTVALEDNTEA